MPLFPAQLHEDEGDRTPTSPPLPPQPRASTLSLPPTPTLSPTPRAHQVGELLRFSQDWVMYSPQPPRDGGWWQVRGVSTPHPAGRTSIHDPSRSGDAARAEAAEAEAAEAGVDVLRGLRDGVWEQTGLKAAEHAQLQVPSLLYRSWRWERYLNNVGKLAGRRAWLPRVGSGAASFGDADAMRATPLRGRRGCAAGDNAEATERLEWLAAYLCARWAAAAPPSEDGAPHPASVGGGAVLELDWLYVRLPPPGASTVLTPTRTRELTYAC